MRKLTEEEIDKEVEDLNNEHKWGDKIFIHMKNLYKKEFGFMYRQEKDSIYSNLAGGGLKKFESTKHLVSSGWVVD